MVGVERGEVFKQRLGRAEIRHLPAVVNLFGAPIHPLDGTCDDTTLLHQLAYSGVGFAFFHVEQGTHLLDGDAALFFEISHDKFSVLVGRCRGTAEVHQFAVEWDRREGSFPPAEEFPVGDAAGVEAVYLPVPRSERVLLAVKPKLGQRKFLDGIAWDGAGEKRDDT